MEGPQDTGQNKKKNKMKKGKERKKKGKQGGGVVCGVLKESERA